MSRTHYYEWQTVQIECPEGERHDVEVKFEVYQEDEYNAAFPCDFENPLNLEWLTLTYLENKI